MWTADGRANAPGTGVIKLPHPPRYVSAAIWRITKAIEEEGGDADEC